MNESLSNLLKFAIVQYFFNNYRKQIMGLKIWLSTILLLGVVCFVSAGPSPDIVGGTDATISEFPSIVILFLTTLIATYI